MVTKTGGDDADLNDLLPDNGASSSRREMQPLNLEHLSQGELDVPVKYQQSNQCSICALCCAYFS